ncbi:MAG: TonB-dependent receptor [Opitutaceae bacterium]|nr:TonB-dependent receptor [Opitutaceae bacterium]
MNHTLVSHRRTRLFVSSLGALAALAIQASAASAGAPTTVMSPFKVEAEFGVDGLRIQNSQAVLNAQLLEQHGIAQLQDMTGAAPNLATSNSDTRGFGDVLSLRGVTNSIFFTTPGVALVIDDVPAGSVSAYPSGLLGVENFVVKAGPQGTDYGRNAPGGVIDIKTRAPGNRHAGRLVLDYGSYNHSAAQVAAEGPLGPQFGYSLSLALADREGYIRNTFQNKSADDRRSTAGRGALYFKPDAKTQLRAGLAYERTRDDANRLSSLFSRNRYEVGSDLNGTTNVERLDLSFQARRRFDWGSVVATTSRQKFDVDPSVTDLDLSPLPLAFSRVLQGEETWTQEVRFESAPAANQTQWRAGLFYFDTAGEGNALRQFIVPPGGFIPPNFVQTERTIYDLDRKNYAVYGNVDQPIGAQTTLKFGVRLERNEAEISRTKASSNNLGFPAPQDRPLVDAQAGNTASATVGVQQVISPALNLVARTSVARKPEGYSAFTASPALARFGEERQLAAEAGLTFGQPKGRFGGSVLAFATKLRGYQFERTVPGSTDFVVVNAAEVLSRGFEAKFMWNPVERVWWDFQAGYTSATFEDHRDATGVSMVGKRVPYVPRSTLRTGVTVDLGGGFTGNASYQIVGRTFYDERNTAMFAQARYGVANGQLRYRFDQWSVALYGHNLFRKGYYQFINPEIAAGAPGAPRRVGVQLTLQY